MKFLWIALITSALSGFADEITETLPKDHPFFQGSSGIIQLDKILKELKETMGDIPPEVERIAIYQIRTERRDFTPSVTKYIQGKIETIFRADGRRDVISPPELKTLTIVSTDTSFHLSNTVPTMGELWKIGDKLRIDGFLQGSCGKSEDGDVMLNLKLIKHKTAEILWSGDFIAGPNKAKPSVFDLKWSASLPFRLFPIDTVWENDVRLDLDNPLFSQVAFEVAVREALTKTKRLYFFVSAGFSWTSMGKDDATEMIFKRFYTMQAGVGLIAVIIQRANPDRGYWLGTYAGASYYIPFFFTGAFPALSVGYSAQLSRHFSVRLGGLYLPRGRTMTGTGTMGSNTQGLVIGLESVAYELELLNYSF
ncbi:hypothetical protein ACFL5V_05840 [Fibrobacterota bacterium]